MLQFRLINRKLKDFWFNAIVGYVFVTALFVGLSLWLFYKISFAEYVFVLCSFGLTSRLSEIKRNDFLKLCFGKRTAMVRIIENLIVSIPFIAMLVYQRCFLFVGILLLINTLMALTNFRTSFSLTIPTPFAKRPFEFTIGFRNTFYLFAIAYCLTIIAASVDNFNLGVFSLLLVYFSIYSYYLRLENEYFVWIYALTAGHFLLEKIKTGLLLSSIIAMPIVVLSGIRFSDNMLPLLVFFALGMVFLLTVILMKYSAFPDEPGLLQGVLFMLALFFPPMLVIVIPFFLKLSIQHLNKFLK